MPILEVNAGYPISAQDILNLEQAFLVRGKPGILVLPNDPNLELAASNAQFQAFSSLVILEVKPVENDLIVEQVSWTQAETLARIWCTFHQALDWQEWVAREITRALQKHSNLTAYLAFKNHEPVGMMLTLETGFSGWLAGETRVLEALTNRLASDFEKAVIAVPLELSEAMPDAKELSRFGVWLKI